MKKALSIFLAGFLLVGLAACGQTKADNKVVIYSTLEDFRGEHLVTRLNEQFPDYEIVLEYSPTGNTGAKLKAEGKATDCDIVVAFDSINAESLTDVFADLSSYDFSHYLDELVPASKTYMIWERWSGCVVTNPEVLASKGLQSPKSYEDLLKPEYKGLISMPNPKSSGTGYFFVYSLVEAWGEDAAFEYFDKLAPNVLQFTSSGSGPVNALLQGEAAIGLAMTFQAVTEKNKGANFDISFFEEGAPYGTSGVAMIAGHETKPAVKAVFDFMTDTLVYEDKELYSPELIFKDQTIQVENYPEVPYADMEGYFNEAEKLRLAEKWKY